MTSKFALKKTVRYLSILGVFTFAAYSWYQRAWTFEDTFITYRVIDNLLEGYGLRWNVAERVQVFTHPLWLFLLAPVYAFTHEVILTTATVSAVCTLITLIALYSSGIYRSWITPSALILLLFVGNTFPSYSSSGFENPLNHLLVCCFSILVLTERGQKSPILISLTAALGMTTRLDTALFYLPTLLVMGISERKNVQRIVVGLLPLLVWELFSLLYYGSLVPNTALAKIPNGIEQTIILRQGLAYLADLFSKDLISSVVIALSLLQILSTVSQLTRGNFKRLMREPLLLLNLGTLLYCLYVVWVGGDYLSYRFWSLPLLASGISSFYWLERLNPTQPCILSRISIAMLFVCAGSMQLFLNNTDSSRVTNIGDDRVNDFFAPIRLPTYIRNRLILEHPWKNSGLELQRRASELHAQGKSFVSEQSLVGLIGYYAGPYTHIVEPYALTEPLLARLPTTGTWRIGHFPRQIPRGYIQWLTDRGESQIDPDLRQYLETLNLITRQPVFSSSRLRSLIPFALGVYDDKLRAYIAKSSEGTNPIRELSALSHKTAVGSPWNQDNHVIIPSRGSLKLLTNRVIEDEFFEIAVDCNDTYQIDFIAQEDTHFRTQTGPGACPGMIVVQLPIPAGARNKLIQKILITPISGDDLYSVGHFILYSTK